MERALWFLELREVFSILRVWLWCCIHAILGGGGGKYAVCVVVVLYTPGWREHCGLIGGGR